MKCNCPSLDLLPSKLLVERLHPKLTIVIGQNEDKTRGTLISLVKIT